MDIITNCPVSLADWKIFDQEARPHRFSDLAMVELWKEFAGNDASWHLGLDGPGIPDGLAFIVEKSKHSQFDQIVELARSGRSLPEFLACVALEGDNFHGQSERPWKAVRGNLHLTLFLKPKMDVSRGLDVISILPTLALVNAYDVIPNSSRHTGIRWFNDLFIEGKKIGGTITLTQIEASKIDSIVYGIGLNVEAAPDVLPNPFVPATGSLQSAIPETGWTLGTAFAALMVELNRLIEEVKKGLGERLKTLYISKTACLDEEVRIWSRKVRDITTEEPIASGKLLEIKPDLSLIIEGHPEPIFEGRLAFEPDCRLLGV